MISDSERREVARDLRRPYGGGVQRLINRWRDSGLDERQSFAEYLADLIDRPTCHMEHTDTYRTSEGLEIRTWECDRCGRTCEDLNGSYEFCPHCGAEVVE